MRKGHRTLIKLLLVELVLFYIHLMHVEICLIHMANMGLCLLTFSYSLHKNDL